MLAACTYSGRGVDDPVIRRLSWFSYISGDDIRAACDPASLDRYRLVYNARYQEQLRSYEIVADGAGGAIFVARALGSPTLARLSANDLLAPWRWRRSEARLTAAEFAAFRRVLAGDGFFAPPPVGLRLYSGGFWWVASGCTDGRFQFNAWRYPPDRAPDGGPAELAFPRFLFARDATGVPVNPPRQMAAAEAPFGPRGNQDDRVEVIHFGLEVGELGVGGGLRGLF